MIVRFSIYRTATRTLSLLVISVAAWLAELRMAPLASQSVELTWSPSPTPMSSPTRLLWNGKPQLLRQHLRSPMFRTSSPWSCRRRDLLFAVSAVNANAEESDLPTKPITRFPAGSARASGSRSIIVCASRGTDLGYHPDGDVYATTFLRTQSGVYTNSTHFYGTTDGSSPDRRRRDLLFYSRAIDSLGVQNILPTRYICDSGAGTHRASDADFYRRERPDLSHAHQHWRRRERYWEMDQSSDLQTWSLMPTATLWYGDGSDVDVYAWMNGGNRKCSFVLSWCRIEGRFRRPADLFLAYALGLAQAGQLISPQSGLMKKPMMSRMKYRVESCSWVASAPEEVVQTINFSASGG